MSLKVNAIHLYCFDAFGLKASIDDIKQYQLVPDNKLQLIDINNSAYSCTNWNCQCTQHKDGLDSLCQTLFDYCSDASGDTIPMSRPVGRNLPGRVNLIETDHYSGIGCGKSQHDKPGTSTII